MDEELVELVSEMEDASGTYYNLVYYSPNEKGEIPHLRPGKSKNDEWTERGTIHDPEFIREIAKQINQRIPSVK